LWWRKWGRRRKEILARRGAIAHATVRRPGPKLTPETLAELDRLMARLETRLETKLGAQLS
jgi:4-hydroxy-tetrahydrodipicolinate synthase